MGDSRLLQRGVLERQKTDSIAQGKEDQSRELNGGGMGKVKVAGAGEITQW